MSLFGTTYKIKDFNQNVIFKSNNVDSIKECVELAVKEKVDLSGAFLEGADLKGVYFEKANLEGANLEGADLYDAHLSGSNLNNANLERANLKIANLHKVNLEEANLKNANLESANLHSTNLEKANLHNARLQGSHIHNINLEKANIEGVDFTDARFSSDKIKQDCIVKAKKATDAELVKNAQAKIKTAMISGKSR